MANLKITDAIQSTCLANIESNLAILCACLPVYRRPLVKLFPRLFFSLGDRPAHVSQSQERTSAHTEMPNFSEKRNNPYDFITSTNPETRNQHGSNSDGLAVDHVEDIEKIWEDRSSQQNSHRFWSFPTNFGFKESFSTAREPHGHVAFTTVYLITTLITSDQFTLQSLLWEWRRSIGLVKQSFQRKAF